ncbi:MAG: ABC transporter permease [Deltaproteobacteria bacterium]|jgi:peptide/nickel transport system permease protein|nr:ABC transporter permease [Deltaproteobacteria bacterium]
MNNWTRFKNSYFLYSFKREPVAYISFALFIIFVLVALLAPVLSPYDPYDAMMIDIMDSEIPPSWMDEGEERFFMGTDVQGRDLVSAMLYGLRTSVIIGLGAVIFQAVLGITVGLISGYLGGKLDSFLMRVADIQFAIPYLIVAIIASAIFQLAFGVDRFQQLAVPLLIFIIGISNWPMYARTVRASVLGEKSKEYVEAARVIGLNRRIIMFRHILPNTLTPVLVLSTIQVAQAIMSEAALSFLGLGMPISQPSLGSLIKAGFEYVFSGSWWITLFPSILLIVFTLVIILFGDWLRDTLNPKLYKG